MGFICCLIFCWDIMPDAGLKLVRVLILEEEVKPNSVFFLWLMIQIMILMIILLSWGTISRRERAFLFYTKSGKFKMKTN